MNSLTLNTTTNPTDPGGQGSKRGGKGARQSRQNAYRRQKNAETDDAIMSGIFARLKIQDPTAVPSLSLARDMHPATVPIAFSKVPDFVDRIWDTMEAIGTRPFAQLDTAENKSIFKKGILILSEVKVCYAQRAHLDKPDEELPSKKLYTLEELQDFNNMASILPYPLAILLESIGNTVSGKQIVTPLLAEYMNNHAASGAITYAPRQLLPLFRLLRDGIPVNEGIHLIAQGMQDLPNIAWEEFAAPAVPPIAEGEVMVRLTRPCMEFWTEHQGNNIKWTDHEYRIFVKIVQSMSSKKGFNVTTDLSHGFGSMAQTVQVPTWHLPLSCEWFTMTDVTEYDQKLGVAFGLGHFNGAEVQPSRFTGTYTTSYWRGELTPRRVINAMVAGQE